MIPEQAEEKAPCSLVFTADEISVKGLSRRLEVSAQECAAIAKLLDLVSLKSMRMEFMLRRSGRGRFKLTAHLFADVTQSCVLTLDPVDCEIDEPFEIDFWPPEDVAQLESRAEDEGTEVPLEGPEPINEGGIDVGQLAYEHFAAALEPYPRKPGVSFDWRDPRAGPAAQVKDTPFAELARLKSPQRENSK